jgi:folate-dependent phosphoribosylglycinamide formyltransferase PurN
MWVLNAGFVTRWHGRIVSIRPSGLPDFPGLRRSAKLSKPASNSPAVPSIG